MDDSIDTPYDADELDDAQLEEVSGGTAATPDGISSRDDWGEW